MMQLPVALTEAVVPVTVQTAGVTEAKLTVSPELAVADKVTLAPITWLAMGGKLMLWVW